MCTVIELIISDFLLITSIPDNLELDATFLTYFKFVISKYVLENLTEVHGEGVITF